MALGVEMALPQLASGQEGLEVSFTVDAFNDQELTALLKRNAGGDEWEMVTAAKVPGKGLLRLSADALSSNDQLKIELSVTARKVELSQLAYYKVTKASQTYVTLSCDTDATFAGNYRFGFNGQAKVDEIAGKGNHNMALFWEYDTRLGRRWNLDPVIKPWVSSYNTFTNNPLWKMDPNGDDDYFNSQGQFIRHEGKGTLIKIIEGSKTLLFSQFLSSRHSSYEKAKLSLV